MVIYHLDIGHVSEADGGSAVAKRDYVLREGKYAKDAVELVQSGHAHMPDFSKDDPRDFWAAADEHERKNAQVCSEIRVALPIELNEQQRTALVRQFVRERLKDQPCTWAIHRGEDTNPHAHLVFPARAQRAGKPA
ncbi:MAG: MobA/MobL family protein [Alphaproteobacteria bacterium]|nr:MobA/MobL family protein [Alphaproteobacteria bacterium]